MSIFLKQCRASHKTSTASHGRRTADYVVHEYLRFATAQWWRHVDQGLPAIEMSIVLRTIMADGTVHSELCATESEGHRVLEAMLALHWTRGYTVQRDDTTVTVTDGSGAVVQRTEMRSSV